MRSLPPVSQPLAHQPVWRCWLPWYAAAKLGLTVDALQVRLAMPPSTLAYHLGALVRPGVVTQTKEARTVTNRAHLDHLAALADFLLAECCQEARLANQRAVYG